MSSLFASDAISLRRTALSDFKRAFSSTRDPTCAMTPSDLPSARLLAAFAIACLTAAPVSHATIGDSFTGGGLSFLRTASLSDSRRSRISAGKASSNLSRACLARVPRARFRALSGRRGGGLGKLDALACRFAYATGAFGGSSTDPNLLRTTPPLSRQSRRGAPFARRDVLPTAHPSTLGKPETGRRELINRIAPL